MTNETTSETTNETGQPARPPSAAAAAPDTAPPPSQERPRPERSDDRRDDRRDDRGDDRRDDRGDDRGGDRRRAPRRRGCEFCRNKVDYVDYKDVDVLRYYVGDRAKMEPRRKVGTCARHQRMVSQAVKRARYVALMPYTVEHMRKTGFGGGRR